MNPSKQIREDSAATTDGPVIAIREVSKTYQARNGDVAALADVSFDVRRGEFLSIVGPSGCGKSTLLMLIAGLLPASSGTIEVNGRPVSKPVTDLGIVFQEDLLMDWRNAIGNVMIQGDFRKIDRGHLEHRAHELMAMVGLSDFENAYPYELSGGMRQRVAMCRALVHDPPLLLMDEPFGALDALTRDQMVVDLQRIWLSTGCTVVFITHSITEAIFLSDRVLVFGRAPGQIRKELSVDIPRPRHMVDRDKHGFASLEREIRGELSRLGIIRDDTYGVESASAGRAGSAGEDER